ncbi:MAG TPA: 2Fe-2S iron-sulfur cluster-binding protein [Burkholderiales bacterium]|nr:2Fe-2S iron-sulfur cluster-binding protein [Burkholderiales bacterium]
MRIQVNARNRAYQFEAAEKEKILYAGLRAKIELPYECGTGTCGTCKAKLIEGNIEDGWPDAPGKKYLKSELGEFLMCQCSAQGDVAAEVSQFVYITDPGSCPARPMTGTVEAVRALTPDVKAIDVALDAPCDFDAGQFMVVTAPGIPGRRGYSMVNFKRQTRQLQFVIKKKPGGGFSEWLFSGKAKGAQLDLIGPLGKATFYPSLAKNILCIAGGSGIAGIMSILSRACQECYFEQYQGHVYFGVRSIKDAFYLDELVAYRKQFPQKLDIVVAFSDEDVPPAAAEKFPLLRFEHGLVHEVAKRGMAGRYQNLRAYVAGPPPAVDAAIRMLLLEAKLTADNIRYDKFS